MSLHRGKTSCPPERGARLTQFVWRKVLDTVERTQVGGKTRYGASPVLSGVHFPCHVQYVMQPQIVYIPHFGGGTKAEFTEVTQPAAKHNCLSGKITGERELCELLYLRP